MDKKDLLADIQNKIDICNKHISQSPYEPAQKRVQYVLNNKCRALNVPFYLNAIYNERQTKLITDSDIINKFMSTTEETFTLTDIQKFNEISLSVDEYEYAKDQRRIKVQNSGGKEKYTYDWCDVMESIEFDPETPHVALSKRKDVSKSNKATINCSSISDLIYQYAIRKDKTTNQTNEEVYMDPNYRVVRTYKYELEGQIDITDHVNSIIEKVKNEQLQKYNSQDSSTQYSWEYYGWEFYMDDKLEESYSIEDVKVEEGDTEEQYRKKAIFAFSIKDLLDKLDITKTTNSATQKLAKENQELDKLNETFEDKYFIPYRQAYENYMKKYGSKKELNERQVNAYNSIKDKVDNMFNAILPYENKISLNSKLYDAILKYKQSKNISSTTNTSQYNDLLTTRKEMQQVLNTRDIDLINQYQRKLAALENNFSSLNMDIVTYDNLASYVKEQINFIRINNQKQVEQLTSEYDQSLLQQKDANVNFKVVVKFRPTCVAKYFWTETLERNFDYEQLENRIKEIVEAQNAQKENQLYLNTSGRAQYQANKEKLRAIDQQRSKEQVTLTELENSYPKQQLEQLYYYRDNYSSSFSKDSYSQLLQQIYDLETQYKPLLDEIEYTKNRVNQLNNQYYDISQQCYYYEARMTPQIQETTSKYDIYNQQARVQGQLDIINAQMEQIAAIRNNQTILNNQIVSTNSSYISLKYQMSSYFLMKQQFEALEKRLGDADGSVVTEYYKLREQIKDYETQHTNDLKCLEIYKQDLEKERQDYLANVNYLASVKDFDTRKHYIETQLAEINEQIALLESPQVTRNVGVTEQGVAYEMGYTFSPNGLYKNLYIDTQQENDWVVIKQQLENLYANYDFYLPDEVEDPEDKERKLPQVNQDGSIQLFNDNNKDGKCNWFIPMDYEIFGIPSVIPFVPLTVKVQKRDQYGQRIPLKDGEGNIIPGQFEVENRQMAVQDGYGFIYTGQNITLYYIGIPLNLPNISVTIPGVGLEYGALFAGGYIALTPLNIYLLRKYPYQNNIPGGVFHWLQTGVVKDIMATVKGKFPIEVTFKIYKKFPLPCGYPKKCGLMSNKDFDCRGKCGLRQFFENTHDLNTQFDENSFDMSQFVGMAEDAIPNSLGPIIKKTTSQVLGGLADTVQTVDSAVEKVYDLYRKNFGNVGERAAQIMEQKRHIAEWGNASYTIATNIWNIADSMSNISLTKDNVKGTVQNIINKMGGQLADLIPPECRDSICQTWRESKQDSIKDLGNTVEESTNTTVQTLGTFIEKTTTDTFDQLKDAASKTVDGIEATIKTAFSGLVNFGKQFDFWSLTQYCPRRLADVTRDINPIQGNPLQLPNGDWQVPEGIDIFNQIGMMVGDQIIGNVMGALNNCVTRSITNHNIHYSNLFPDGTRKYLEAANSIGDIASLTKEIKGRGLTLDNLFHEANRSVILSELTNFDTANISLGYLTDELGERGWSSVIDINATLQPNEVIDGLKNTISRAVANNNDIIDKIKKGEILSMNDQFKQITDIHLAKKTEQWARDVSDKVNTVTTIGENVKGLLKTDWDSAWNNPHQVTNKIQKITDTMSNMLMKQMLQQKKDREEIDEAFANSQQLVQMKNYGVNRYEYLEQLTGQDFSEQKDKIKVI